MRRFRGRAGRGGMSEWESGKVGGWGFGGGVGRRKHVDGSRGFLGQSGRGLPHFMTFWG